MIERTMLWLRRAIPILSFFGLAVLLRWPASAVPGLLPADINSQHHIVVFSGLQVDHFAPGCADPTPEKLAWAIGLLHALAALVLPTAWAYQIACVSWLALHGVAGWLMGGALQWPRPRRWVTALAMQGSALGMMFLNSGRIEHLVLPWFALCAVGMSLRRRGLGLLLAAAGLGLAAQSSPYQAVPGGLLLLSLGAASGWRALARAAAASALAAIPTLILWGRAAKSEAIEMFLLPLGVRELLWDPQPWHSRAVDLSPKSLAALTHLPAPDSEQFLGVVLGLGGLAGAARCWRAPMARAAAACMLACVVLGLGHQLRWSADGASLAWMPWAWLSQISALKPMMNTNRFLTGAVFAGAVGLGMLAGRSRGLAVGLCAALLAETMLLAPSGWPAAVVRLDPDAIPAEAADVGPLLLWPPGKWLSNGVIDLISLETDQDLLVLTEWTCDAPSASIGEMLSWARAQGATHLLELPSAARGGPPPLPIPPPRQPTARGTEAALWPLP